MAGFSPGVPLSPEEGGGILLPLPEVWRLADEQKAAHPEIEQPQVR